MPERDDGFDYVSRADCGCAVAICSDLRDRFTARFVADEVRAGRSIERMARSDAVAALMGDHCEQRRAERQRRREAAPGAVQEPPLPEEMR